ncbi:MFS transporter [Streptomyces sp. NPDC055025]
MKPAGPDSLRRNRDFQILCVGQGLSMLGSAASALALPLLVLNSTGSPLRAGLVEAVWAGSLALASLPGGTIADRFDRRSVLLVCELGRVAASLVLAVAVQSGNTALPLLLGVGAVLGFLTAPSVAAGLAALTRIVPENQLGTALTVNRVRGQAAYLLGPVLGGWLFTLSPGYPFWLDAASFAVAAASVYAVRTPLSAATAAERESGWVERTGAGLRFVWRDSVLRRVSLIAAGQNFVLDGTYLTVVVVSSRQGPAGLSMGAIAAASAMGALAGILLMPRVSEVLRPTHVLFVSGAVCAGLVAAMALGSSAALLAVLMGGCSMAISLSSSLTTVTRMLRTPDHLQGRVHSAVGLLLMAAPPLGSTLTGLFLEHLPAPAVFVTLGILLVPLALITPRLDAPAPRAAPDPPTPHPAVPRPPTPPSPDGPCPH